MTNSQINNSISSESNNSKVNTEEVISITVDKITFHDPKNGYTVLRGKSLDGKSDIVVVGNLGLIIPGEEIKAYGKWVKHNQYGVQFQATSYTKIKPATLRGIEKFLGSGLIKGIGPVTAKKLVAEFGIDTLNIIENHPEKLLNCPGIGKYRAEKILEGWKQQKAIQDIMVFLQGHGISPTLAIKVYKLYGKEVIKKVSEDPYILAYEVDGIGFKTADKIAHEFGIKGADLRRIKAGIFFTLYEAKEDGHTFLYEDELVNYTKELLNIDSIDVIKEVVTELFNEGKLILKEYNNRKIIYLPHLYYCEEGVANYLLKILNSPDFFSISRDLFFYALESAFVKTNIKLSDVQQLAIEKSLKEKVIIITGGPGTGKTTTLKAIVEAHRSLNRKVILTSPTGRAAKRLYEVTGYEAKTIHRLLEYNPEEHSFRYNHNNQIECDTIILDEASMVDIELFYYLLRAIKPTSKFIIVGDADQLPSVGPGLVLQQLISSSAVPTVKLTTIFRQNESSIIIKNAHRINKGIMPILIVPDGKTKTDCYYIDCKNPDETICQLCKIISTSLPKRFGYDPINDIQVLTPTNKGILGSINLNNILQEILNPPSSNKIELKLNNKLFRVGDKVIQTKNNYELDIYNGDIGIIKSINTEDQELVVEFPQGEKLYQATDIPDLSLAYAITIHKSQGSEYPAVVMILSTQHYVMLQRNLIYTGITRAKKTFIFLSSKQAIAMAIKNSKPIQRNTLLDKLIIEKFKNEMYKENI